jgi:hypothetical protein
MGVVPGGVKTKALLRLGTRVIAAFTVLGAYSLTINFALADKINGAWLSPADDNWPLVAVHAILTPDGRVLTYGSDSSGAATGLFQYDVWDPAGELSGGHLTLQNFTLTDIFCSYSVILPDNGNILIAGGDTWDGTGITKTGNRNSTIYQPDDATLTRANDMEYPRWYATATPLMNGEIYIQGGKGGEAFPEVRDRNGIFRTLTGAPTGNYWFWYPRNFLAPDGRVFGFDDYGLMYFVSTGGVGSLTPVGQLGATNASKVSATTMFRPGKILHVVGKNKKALIIDINGPQPIVTPTDTLSAHRTWASATVLADGQVLVTGGSGVANTLTDVTNRAEIWNPDTGTWKLGAAGLRPRLYHSFALLLPDASVLVGGGGASDDSPVTNLHSEIYYPPYLYEASGGFANRPVIESAPNTLAPGLDFSMQIGGAGSASRVTLLQTGAPTHSINLQQRFVELPFAASSDTLFVEMHDRATDVPPGYYLLFVINNSGVPSVGKIVRIEVPGSGGGQDTTAPTKPENLTISRENGNPKLVWQAASDAGGVAGYTVYRSDNGTLGTEVTLTTATTWTDTTVEEGTRYTYGIKAYDAAGNLSQPSVLKSITAYEKPTKPANFGVTLQSGDPKLTFTASTDNVGVVGYNVYRSTNGKLGPLFTQISGSPWVDSSAQAGVTYTYAVRARDAAGYLSKATSLKTIKAQ